MTFSKQNIARFLLVIAAGVSGFLAWQSFGSSAIAGCDGGNCDQILASSWARLFGMPVAILGTIVYLTAAFLGERVPQAIRSTILLSIPLAAAWFVGVQLFAIGAFCTWCCVAHGLASVGAVLALSSTDFKSRRIVSPLLGSFAAVAMLASLQLIVVDTAVTNSDSFVEVYELDPITTTEASSDILREVKLLNGEVTFRLDEMPIAGVSKPTRAIVVLTDYTCPHCRQLNDVLQEAGLMLDNGVAILKLPATRKGTDSEQIHRHMLALWKASPQMHWTLERKLIEGRIPVTAKAVEAEAKRLIGQHDFAEATVRNHSWITEQIEKTKRVREANREKTGKGTLPQVMVGSELVFGAHSDPKFYVQLAEKQFGLVAAREEPEAGAISAVLEADSRFDLGEVGRGQSLPFTLKFVNPNQDLFEISWLNMGANLSIGSFTKTELMQGGEGQLDLVLEVPEDAPSGRLIRTVTVNAKEGCAPISFQVSANVSAGIAQVSKPSAE